MIESALIADQQHTIVKLETMLQDYSDLLHHVLDLLSQFIEVEDEEIRLKQLDGEGGL